MMLLAAASAWSAQCTVTSAGLTFGSYDVFDPQPTDSAGTITVSCDLVAPYTIALSTGLGTYEARHMVSGPYLLHYNLYVDPERLTIWGDGSAATAVASGEALTGHHTVYGRIPARQNAQVGTYADIVTITVTF